MRITREDQGYILSINGERFGKYTYNEVDYDFKVTFNGFQIF